MVLEFINYLIKHHVEIIWLFISVNLVSILQASFSHGPLISFQTVISRFITQLNSPSRGKLGCVNKTLLSKMKASKRKRNQIQAGRIKLQKRIVFEVKREKLLFENWEDEIYETEGLTDEIIVNTNWFGWKRWFPFLNHSMDPYWFYMWTNEKLSMFEHCILCLRYHFTVLIPGDVIQLLNHHRKC